MPVCVAEKWQDGVRRGLRDRVIPIKTAGEDPVTRLPQAGLVVVCGMVREKMGALRWAAVMTF